MSEQSPGEPPQAEGVTQKFSGRVAFAQAVRETLRRAADERWPELLLADADFADWPLGDRAVVESLNAWAHSKWRLVIHARHYRAVTAQHHRFVTWRKQWQHIVTAWACPSIEAVLFPSMLLGGQPDAPWVLHRLDAARSVGVIEVSATRQQAARGLLQQLQDRSSPGFAAQVLGL